MSRLNIAERARILAISAKRSHRAAVARARHSRFLRWQFGPSHLGQLLIVPQDLRTADPSFWQELQLDQFGLAGTVAALHGKSPFEIRPPNATWERALHGFGWLRHLAATPDEEAFETARRLAVEWNIRYGNSGGMVWQPGVAGRRIISWLSHAGMLLENADAETYDTITQSLSAQIMRLGATWRDGPDGHPRLIALIALVLADLCVAGQDRRLDEAARLLSAEIERQILPDGGHISRNPWVLVELMLDLLPMRQCFIARGLAVPDLLIEILGDVVAFLRFMRLGDGRLARFNGVSVAAPAGLATVLAYDENPRDLMGRARESGYVRLPRGGTIIIADAGRAPPMEFAAGAHAGCLSFEMSVGTRPLIVNGGAPLAADHDWHAISRSTASHSTLCLNEMSSAKMIRNRRLESLIGGVPIAGPPRVKSEVSDVSGALMWTARHDGYYDRTGLWHHRTITVSASGASVSGNDRLSGSTGMTRLGSDLPFSIHFHLHPDVNCRLERKPDQVILTTSDNQIWCFSAEGASLNVEESMYFADASGPRRSLQIVLRGATYGETDVRWRLDARA